MENLFEKEEELILAPLKEIANSSIIDNGVNVREQKVILIKSLRIEKLNINYKKSNLRDVIVINGMTVSAEVFVIMDNLGTKSLESLIFKFSNEIILKFNTGNNTYELVDRKNLKTICIS